MTTLTDAAGRTGLGEAATSRAIRPHPYPDPLALCLITLWALRTGRSLRPVPVAALSAEELIEFWSDDLVANADP